MQVINELYDRYGYYQNTTLSYSFEGAEGMEIMAGKMSFMREPPLPGDRRHESGQNRRLSAV